MSRPKNNINAFTLPTIVALLLLFAPPIAAIKAEDRHTAVATVEQLHDALVQAMQNGEQLGYQGRYDKLKPVIESAFDIPLIARVIMGRYWGDLSDSQKNEFIQVFKQLTIATYANRFDSYDGESFKYLGTESLKKARVLVQTQLEKPNGEKVSFDYLLHQRKEQWYIMSVVAQGVNDLSLKRAEYSSIMESRGFDGLISDLRDKIAALEPAEAAG